jgi:hypothetical protein
VRFGGTDGEAAGAPQHVALADEGVHGLLRERLEVLHGFGHTADPLAYIHACVCVRVVRRTRCIVNSSPSWSSIDGESEEEKKVEPVLVLVTATPTMASAGWLA